MLLLHLALAGLDKVLLELFIGSSRFHNLLHLVLGIFDNLVGSLLLRLQQLDAVVQAQHVQLHLVATLPDLRHRDQVFHGAIVADTAVSSGEETSLGCCIDAAVTDLIEGDVAGLRRRCALLLEYLLWLAVALVSGLGHQAPRHHARDHLGLHVGTPDELPIRLNNRLRRQLRVLIQLHLLDIPVALQRLNLVLEAVLRAGSHVSQRALVLVRGVDINVH